MLPFLYLFGNDNAIIGQRKRYTRLPAVDGGIMAEKFVPKGKLSKKARKELDRQKRVTWAFSPVTKKVESKKLYSRKRKTQDREIY